MIDSKYQLIRRRSETLVIHCVDHRFQDAFEKYIKDGLKIAVFNPLVIAGGALGIASDHYAKFGYIWDQVDFFINERGINRIILINHEDCLWYKYEHPDFLREKLREQGRSDLKKAAGNIRYKHPDVDIIIIWAAIEGNNINFEKLK